MPPSTSKEFRFSKNKHPNLKDANNTTVDETCDKCGETEDTVHLFLEYVQYQEKIWRIFQQLLNKAQRRLHIREQAKKQKQCRYHGRRYQL